MDPYHEPGQQEPATDKNRYPINACHEVEICIPRKEIRVKWDDYEQKTTWSSNSDHGVPEPDCPTETYNQ